MPPVRRSARANKGRNQKLEQELEEYKQLLQESIQEEEGDQEKGNNSEEDVEPVTEGDVRCLVCGTLPSNYDEDDDRTMIECESCKTWQHSECILKDPHKIPKVYNCNVCDASNPHYKTLTYKIDPAKYLSKPESTKKASVKKSTTKRVKKEVTSKNAAMDDADDADFDDISKQNGKLSEDDDESGEEEDDEEEEDAGAHLDADDEEYDAPSKSTGTGSGSKKRTRKDSRASTSSGSSSKRSSVSVKPEVKKIDAGDIENKARSAVTKRFEGMFIKLLPGHEIPSETGSIEEISQKWAKKLEDELYKYYHDRETGKLTKDYKETSARIFVNVKDEKNIKLRHSIINKSISFEKLVNMPVNELLNPDLRKEKEEAIRESMTQATLEIGEVSNIRRTHKGDIVLEKEDTSNNQQFDFNVGISIANDDKKFINSETNVSNERKNSLYASNTDRFDDDDEVQNNDNNGVTGDLDAEVGDYGNYRELSGTPDILDEEDEDFEKLLGEEKEKKEQEEQEAAVAKTEPIEEKKIVWRGQTVFTSVTNFDSQLSLVATTLANSEFERLAPYLFQPNSSLGIEGRLDAKKADDFITRSATARRLIFLELNHNDDVEGFEKLFHYFYSKNKYGVIIRQNQPFVKDAYILPVLNKNPKFLTELHKKELPGTPNTKRIFVIYLVKQEMIKGLPPKPSHFNTEAKNPKEEPLNDAYDAGVTNDDEYDPTSTSSNPKTNDDGGLSFLSNLNPNELALVYKIFDQFPETKTDPNLLIQHVQRALTSGIDGFT